MGEAFRVTIEEGESVSATRYGAAADRRLGVTLILGHGAGAGQKSPFMVGFATALAGRGIDTVTFDFAYMEAHRRLPDRNERLEACYRAVIDTVRRDNTLGRNALAIGGKSMGGRIGSQVAAGATGLAGVVLLGYPLHPPGKPQQLRTQHLPKITVPLLFVQGARDSFGSEDELRAQLKGLKRAELYVVADGDHSFKVPKRAGVPQEAVYAGIQDKIAAWMALLMGAA